MSHNCPANGIFKNSLLGLGLSNIRWYHFFRRNYGRETGREKEPVPFPVEIAALDFPRSNMFAASCGMTQGFSGAGLFRVYGKSDRLLGICTRGRVPSNEWLTKWHQEGWLHRRSVSYYTTSGAIVGIIEQIIYATSSPPPKKSLLMKKEWKVLWSTNHINIVPTLHKQSKSFLCWIYMF